ncbi:MAG: extracellular solute-binding protein [Clostridia bacterium]|nr:extracellular solute-binding protein [Clostridia bacterium]
MKRILKSGIVGLAVCYAVGQVGALTACRTTGENSDAITITVWTAEGDAEFMKWAQEEFKRENPNKKYNFVIDYQGENDIATRILNDVENAADVFSFPNDQIAKLVNGDALSRLGGEVLEDALEDLDEKAMDSATIKKDGLDQVYGLPYTDNTFFLYYDKSVLTEEDVRSLDGILSKCTVQKQFAMPFNDGWYSSAFYFGKGLGYNVTYDANFAETKIECDFDSEIGEQVTQAMWQLAQDQRVKADANDSKITAGFNDGSIVAATTGIWNKTAIKNYLGDNFAVAKLPTYTYAKGTDNEEQVQLVSFAGYKLLGVNNYSKQKSEAVKFAKFCVEEESQIKRFDLRGYLPTDEDARENERVQSDACARAIAAQLAHSKEQKNVPSTLWVPMEGLGNAMITGVASGNFNVKQQLQACVSAIKK